MDFKCLFSSQTPFSLSELIPVVFTVLFSILVVCFPVFEDSNLGETLDSDLFSNLLFKYDLVFITGLAL